MELLDVKLRAFPHPAPEDGPSLLMDFEHVPFRVFLRETEHLLENHGHVTHQVDRIVVNDDLPGQIEFLGRASFLLDDRVFD